MCSFSIPKPGACRRFALLPLVLAGLLISACGAPGSGPETAKPGQAATGTAGQAAGPGSGATGSPAPEAQGATADLAAAPGITTGADGIPRDATGQAIDPLTPGLPADPPPYTLSYRAPDASAGAVPQDATAYQDKQSATLAGAGSLSRAHYDFAGWSSLPDGKGTRFRAGQKLELPGRSLVLHAVWTPKPSYPVVYRSRFQQSGTPPVDPARYEAGDPVTLAGNTGKLARSAWVFAGWSANPEGKGPILAPGSRQAMGAAALELHAVWRLDTVAVPAGSYSRDDLPNQKYKLSAFRIGRYEVTREQFQAIAGLSWQSGFEEVPNGPADRVNWYMALVFCNRLSQYEGLKPVYSLKGSADPNAWGPPPTSDNPEWNAVAVDREANGYRLPTEAEWQWAAMGASNKTAREFAGAKPGLSMADFAWYRDNSGQTPHPVGSLKPNELGIYDLSGNLSEWCQDWFGVNPEGDLADWAGPPAGKFRSLRGGSWYYTANTVAINYRNSFTQWSRDTNIGFRVVRR